MSTPATLFLACAPWLSFAAQDASPGKLWIEARDGTLSTRALAGLDVERLGALDAVVVRAEGFAPVGLRAEVAARCADVRLVDGDHVNAAVLGGAGERLEVELAGGARTEFEVERLERLVSAALVEPSVAQTLEAAPKGDRLYWSRPSGLDRLDGTLQEFSVDGVVFDSSLGARTFPWAEVAALFVEPLGRPAPAARSAASVCVEFADGGRLHAELVRLGAQGLRLRRGAGAEMAVPFGALAEVALDDGSVEYLSTRAPDVALEGWPPGDELGLRWPFQLDRSVTGEPLRAGGRSWSRGLGVHAPSRLEWKLDGSWSALRGSVAVDDSVLLLPYHGSVEFSLHLDGAAEPAWRSGRVRGGSAPVALPELKLAGVTRIALVVDMDERAHVADRADWLRMLLVR